MRFCGIRTAYYSCILLVRSNLKNHNSTSATKFRICDKISQFQLNFTNTSNFHNSNQISQNAAEWNAQIQPAAASSILVLCNLQPSLYFLHSTLLELSEGEIQIFTISLSLYWSLSLSLLVRSCLLNTLIKCLKGHKSSS